MFGYRVVRLWKLGFCRFDNRTFGYRAATVLKTPLNFYDPKLSQHFRTYQGQVHISTSIHPKLLNMGYRLEA